MTLSIIVPVYNIGAYLERCLRSLLAQGLAPGEYEILLVNDGSTDNSLDICRRYEAEHPGTIRVVSQENQGVSVARNRGMAEAKGNWLCFVDGDDYLIPGGYRYLMDNFLDDSIDILFFWCLTLDRKTKQTFVETNDVTGKIYEEINGIEALKYGNQVFVVSSLYKREFLVSHNLQFKPHMNIGEDALFSLDLYLKNPKVRRVSSRLYRYDHHEGSAVNRRDKGFMRKAINSYMVYMREMSKRISENSGNQQLCRGLQNIVLGQLTPLISRILSSDYSVKEFKQLRQELIHINILPPPRKTKNSLSVRVVRAIFATPMLLPLYEWGYQKIFIPYILPRLSRN